MRIEDGVIMVEQIGASSIELGPDSAQPLLLSVLLELGKARSTVFLGECDSRQVDSVSGLVDVGLCLFGVWREVGIVVRLDVRQSSSADVEVRFTDGGRRVGQVVD